MRLGILGAGFSGREIGALAAQRGFSSWGTTRKVENFADLHSVRVEPFLFDGQEITAPLQQALLETTHLVISIAPPRKEDPAEAITDPFLKALAHGDLMEIAPNLQWVGYLSTVGVYGNHDGAWIDEETPVAPASERSRQRVRAENEWLALEATSALQIAVFRLSGIYGPGRNALVSASEGRSRRLVKPGQVFNRIHVADIATAVNNAACENASGIFNITDNEPCPPQDVVAFAHELIGTEPPEELDFATADLSPMARSFYGENKRVSNAKSKTMLKMDYQNPNYRTALTRMWADGSWRRG